MAKSPRVRPGSLELRILEHVRDNYPVTKDELRASLKVSEGKLDLALKRLEKAGYIEYDVLPDKVYIRLKVVLTGPKAGRSKKKADQKRMRKGDTDGDDFSYV